MIIKSIRRIGLLCGGCRNLRTAKKWLAIRTRKPLLFVGMMMIFSLDYYEVFIAPFLAVNYTDVITDNGAGDTMGIVAIAFPASGLLTVVGYALLGVSWKKANALPTAIAVSLIITSIAFGVGLSPIGGIVVAQITAAAFGAALVATGVCAIRRQQRFTSSG